jgi:hypothetical protein
VERHIVRETPSSPVFAYEGITELTRQTAERLVSQLRHFLSFYRSQCAKHRLGLPDPDRQ